MEPETFPLKPPIPPPTGYSGHIFNLAAFVWGRGSDWPINSGTKYGLVLKKHSLSDQSKTITGMIVCALAPPLAYQGIFSIAWLACSELEFIKQKIET